MLLKYTITTEGEYKKTQKWLNSLLHKNYLNILNKYGRKGVNLLAAYTPKDTGKTAESWYFEVEDKSNGEASLIFNNRNINKGVPIAIILQYGHGTGTGGWVEGRDYINPALEDIFQDLANELIEEVRRS